MKNWKEITSTDWYNEADKEGKRRVFQGWVPLYRDKIKSAVDAGQVDSSIIDKFNASVDKTYEEDFGTDYLSLDTLKKAGTSVIQSGLSTFLKAPINLISAIAPTGEGEAKERQEALRDLYSIRAAKFEKWMSRQFEFSAKNKATEKFDEGISILMDNSLTEEEKESKIALVQSEFHQAVTDLNDDLGYEQYSKDPKRSFLSDENKALLESYNLSRDPRFKDALRKKMMKSFNDEFLDAEFDETMKEFMPELENIKDEKTREFFKGVESMAVSPDQYATDFALTYLSAGIGKGISTAGKISGASRVSGKVISKIPEKVMKPLSVGGAMAAESIGEGTVEVYQGYLEDPGISKEEVDELFTIGSISGPMTQAGVQIASALPKGKTEVTGEAATVKELTEDQQTYRNIVESKVKEIKNEYDEDINLVDTLDDLDDGIAKTEAKKAEESGENIEAFVDPSTNRVVYNISGIQKQADKLGITIDERMDQLANHEIVTHKGIKVLYSDATEFSNFHEQIYKSFETEIQNNIQPNYKEYDATTEQGRIGLAQEFLANMAENTDLESSVWDNLVESFSKFYKTKINKNYTGLTKAELRNTLRTSYRGLKSNVEQKRAQEARERQERGEPNPESPQGQIKKVTESKLNVPEQRQEYMVDPDGDSKGKLIERSKKSEDPEVSKIGEALENQNKYKSKSIESSINDGDTTFNNLLRDNNDDMQQTLKDAVREIERSDILGIFGENMDAFTGFAMRVFKELAILKDSARSNNDVMLLDQLEARQKRVMLAMRNNAKTAGRFINSLKAWGNLDQGGKVRKMIDGAFENVVTELVDRELIKDTGDTIVDVNNKALDSTVEALVSDIPENLEEAALNEALKDAESVDIEEAEQTEMDLFATPKEEKVREGEKFTLRNAVIEEGGIKPPPERAGGEYDGYYTGDKNKDGSRKKKKFAKGVISKTGYHVDVMAQRMDMQFPQLGINGDANKFWELLEKDEVIVDDTEYETQRMLDEIDFDDMTDEEVQNLAMGTDEIAELAKKELDARKDLPFSKQREIQFSKQSDEKYLELAKDRKANKAELQKMVDEAAKEAGYNIKAYHGTSEIFNIFRSYMPNFFTENKEYAKGYSGKGKKKGFVLNLAIKLENPLDTRTNYGRDVFNKEFLPWVREKGWRPENYKEGAELKEGELLNFIVADHVFPFIKHLNRKGDNRFDGYLVDEAYDNEISMVPISNSQIKSAEPVVEDDAGNIIPLSQRFDNTKDDIRFSKQGVAKKGDVLVRMDKEGTLSNTSKPQGLYLNQLGGETGVTPEMGESAYYKFNPKKSLDVSKNQEWYSHERFFPFKGKYPVSAGIRALRELVGEKDFNKLMSLSKDDLIVEIKDEYSDVDWNKYFDSYEILEGLAGLKAREAGYDSILDPEETIVLEESAIDKTDAPSIQFSKQRDPKTIYKGLTPQDAKIAKKNSNKFVQALKVARQTEPDILDTYKKVAMAEMNLSAKGTDRFARNFYAYTKSKFKGLQAKVKKAQAAKPKDAKEASVMKLVREFAGGLDPATQKVLDPILQSLVSNVRKAMNESIKGLREEKGIDTTKKKKTDTEILRDALKNYTQYKELWAEFEQSMADKYKDNPKKLAEFDEIFDSVAEMNLSDRVFRGVLREQQKNIEKKLVEVVREAKANSSAELSFRDALVASAVSEMGLSPTQAKIFADRFNKVFSEEASKARKNAVQLIIDRHEKTVGNKSKLDKKKKTALSKLIEFGNLNVFSNEDAYNAIREGLGLPAYTPAIAKEVQKYVDNIQKHKMGSIQQRAAVIEFEQYLADTIGIDSTELIYSIYLSAMLSGYTTQAINVISGALNLFASTPSLAFSEAIKNGFKNPLDLAWLGLSSLVALWNGVMPALSQAKFATKTGIISEEFSSTVFSPKAIETARFGDRKMKYKEGNQFANAIAYLYRTPVLGHLFYANKAMGRLLVGADAFFRELAYQQKTEVMAMAFQKQKGMGRFEAYRKAQDILYRTPAKLEAAKKQAIKEGATKEQLPVRVREIIRENIRADIANNNDPDYVSAGEEYGGIISFNHKPRNTLIGTGAAYINMGFNMAGKNKNPFIRGSAFVLKAIFIPFVNVVANVSDRMLDFDPMTSSSRLVLSRRYQPDFKGSEADYRQRGDLITGGLGLMFIMGLAMMKGDDDEPILRLTTTLDRDPNKKKTALGAGEMEFSFDINIGGKRTSKFSFKDTPFSRMMLMVGIIQEKTLKGESVNMDTVGQYLVESLHMWSSQNFIQSVISFADLISVKDMADAEKRLKNIAAPIPSRVLLPAQNLLLQINRAFDDDLPENKTLAQAFTRNLPIARSYTKPMLNAYGEVIKTTPSNRFTNMFVEVNDPSKFMHDNGLKINVPDFHNYTFIHKQGTEMEIVKELSEEEKYELHRRSSKEYMEKFYPRIVEIAPKLNTAEKKQNFQKVINDRVNKFRRKAQNEMQKEINEGKSFD